MVMNKALEVMEHFTDVRNFPCPLTPHPVPQGPRCKLCHLPTPLSEELRD